MFFNKYTRTENLVYMGCGETRKSTENVKKAPKIMTYKHRYQSICMLVVNKDTGTGYLAYMGCAETRELTKNVKNVPKIMTYKHRYH